MELGNITVNTQSSIRIETSSGVLYFDPLDIGTEAHDADIVFITHDHYDHFSPLDILKVIKPGTVLVLPEKMKKDAAKVASAEISVFTVGPGKAYEIGGFNVETVASYNKLKPFHPKRSGWCGYVVEADGIRYYIAGDTDAQEDNLKVKCDVALVPIGGTYTMDHKEAAKFINAIKPRAAIPTHYGSIVGKSSDGESFKKLVDPEIQVELKR